METRRRQGAPGPLRLNALRRSQLACTELGPHHLRSTPQARRPSSSPPSLRQGSKKLMQTDDGREELRQGSFDLDKTTERIAEVRRPAQAAPRCSQHSTLPTRPASGLTRVARVPEPFCASSSPWAAGGQEGCQPRGRGARRGQGREEFCQEPRRQRLANHVSQTALRARGGSCGPRARTQSCNLHHWQPLKPLPVPVYSSPSVHIASLMASHCVCTSLCTPFLFFLHQSWVQPRPVILCFLNPCV